MNELLKRSITGAFFVALLVAGIWVHPISYLSLFAFITGGTIYEFYRIVIKRRLLAQRHLGTLTGVFLFVITFFHAQAIVNEDIFLILIPIMVLIFISELYKGNLRPFDNIAVSVLGVIYIALPFSLFNYFIFLHKEGQIFFTPEVLLGFFFLLWANDSGAYLAGRRFGKHRLFKRISPKKSWEGFAGGALLSLTVALIISKAFPILRLVDWVAMAVIISIFGVYGDLNESMLKRSLNIKDSGTMLPGHGGLLDRFDSVLLASPIVYLYLRIFVY